MHNVNRFPFSSVATGLVLASSLIACSTVDDVVSGGKVDYRNASTKPTPLEVPPDLTQLAVDPRYAPQAGVISAAALAASGVTTTSAPVVNTPTAVAPAALGDVRVEAQGNLRYLSTPISADQLWPQLEAFWKERGLSLVVNQPDVGVMETDWAENRVKLQDDVIRRTLGQGLQLPLRHRRARQVPHARRAHRARGTDIYIAHRGLEEVYTSAVKDSTTWRGRPSDPSLEAEMLSRLMVKLGAKDEVAKAAVAPGRRSAGRRTGTSPRDRRPPGRDPAARRKLRPRLAPCGPGARPQRLHRRRP